MRTPVALILVATAACSHPYASSNVVSATDGVSIAIYRGEADYLAVIDDRRPVTIANGELVLDQVPAGASLASLTIEPLGGSPLAIGACTRDAVEIELDPEADWRALEDLEYAGKQANLDDSESESKYDYDYESAAMAEPPATKGPRRPHVVTRTQSVPVIRCRVDAKDGSRRMRVLYVVTDLRFDVRSTVVMTAPDRASITSTYSVTTPARGVAGDVTLFTGIPGSTTPPVQVATGTAQLDGNLALFTTPPTEVKARLRPLFLTSENTDTEEPSYGYDDNAYLRGVSGSYGTAAVPRSQPVQVWLDLQATLAPDALVAHVELPGEVPRDTTVGKASVIIDPARGITRAPLWLDEHLMIAIERTNLTTSNRVTRERTRITVANSGDVTREVDFEQKLPLSDRRTLEAIWPETTKPTLVPTGVRAKLAVPPNGLARMRFVVATRAPDWARTTPERDPIRDYPFE